MRLKRFGRRHRAFFRLNVMDQRAPRNGRVIEELGWYDPCQDDPEKKMDLNADRVRYWLSVGARPSETVRDLLRKAGITAEGGSEAEQTSEAAPDSEAEPKAETSEA
jgi:small subunit ribosomal protein S16